MKNQIIIHASGKQTRTALIENGELAQIFLESPENQRTVGDIYIAEVRKVMGGIRAAFIDMNTPKDAFLHFSDLGEHLEDYLVMLNGKGSLKQDQLKKLEDYRKGKNPNQQTGNPKTGITAEEQNLMGNLMQAGHKLLVQIVKEPIGSKGPRVSTNISLAGRFLVLMPMGDYIAVSKRIKSYKERRTLRQVVTSLLPDGFGVIVRTVAEGQDPKLIEEDLKDLLEKWTNATKHLENAKPPTLLHRDLEMTESLVRDLFAKDYERILVDDPKMFKSLRTYVGKIAPTMLPNIELYKGSEHIFDYMKITQDVESVFSPRVKMPSGGYLIFEQTEAMYVVDVNSGRYAAKKQQEENSLKTNLEAAREIAKQLRLRDIGGIIVVDFIDLKDDVNRKKIYDELKKEFKKDRAKTNILPMSDFGLVQITRQRVRPSVVKSVSRVCPMCGGSGSFVSHNTILSDIEGWLNKFKLTTSYWAIDLHINPYMKGMLTKGMVSQQTKWMFKYRLKINIIDDETLSMNDYRFSLAGSDVDITETIIFNQSIDDAIKATEKRIAEMESEDQRDISKLDIFRLDDENGQTVDPKESIGVKKPDFQKTNKSSERHAQPQSRNDRKSSDNHSSPPESQKKKTTISKYYKKNDTNENGDRVESTASASKEVKHIPDSAEKPRSALDVAREFRLKRELEEQKAEKDGSETLNTKTVTPDEAPDTEIVVNLSDSSQVDQPDVNEIKEVTSKSKKAGTVKTKKTVTKKKSETISDATDNKDSKTKKVSATKKDASKTTSKKTKTVSKKAEKPDESKPALKKSTRPKKTPAGKTDTEEKEA